MALDEGAGTATKTWEYHVTGGTPAIALGDAELLPNGNILITNSMSGLIMEIDRAGKIVQQFKNTSSCCTDFRTSPYGPPPR